MSVAPQSPDPTDSSIRPPSVWTNDSVFADSAISMGSRTHKLPEDPAVEMQSPRSADPRLSDQLSQLAAAAWAAEQDRPLHGIQRRKIEEALKVIEDCLDEGASTPENNTTGTDMDDSQTNIVEDESNLAVNPGLNIEELHIVHRSLKATVDSMRLRLQEHQHLKHLAVSKLEAVAQTNVIQKTQLDRTEQEVESLRTENQTLGDENDQLHQSLLMIESEATQKDVAVNAMSSAVAGLEGWINSSHNPYSEQAQQLRPRRGRYVVRGKGRFRSRQYIDDPEEGSVGALNGVDPDARELHDGVRAWLRGFRDVEEELHKASTGDRPVSRTVDVASTNDDWGDFQAVSEPP
jgi:hypothetical protein